MRRQALYKVNLCLRTRQCGLATVEFAIGAPLLLLLLLAVGEFGRMLSQYNTLLQSSRDAVRYASRHSLDRTLNVVDVSRVVPSSAGAADCFDDLGKIDGGAVSVKRGARNLAVYGVPCWKGDRPDPVIRGLNDGSAVIDVDPECGVESRCDHVRVSIRYTFEPVIGSAVPAFFGGGAPLGIELVATTVMRAQ